MYNPSDNSNFTKCNLEIFMSKLFILYSELSSVTISAERNISYIYVQEAIVGMLICAFLIGSDNF